MSDFLSKQEELKQQVIQTDLEKNKETEKQKTAELPVGQVAETAKVKEAPVVPDPAMEMAQKSRDLEHEKRVAEAEQLRREHNDNQYITTETAYIIHADKERQKEVEAYWQKNKVIYSDDKDAIEKFKKEHPGVAVEVRDRTWALEFKDEIFSIEFDADVFDPKYFSRHYDDVSELKDYLTFFKRRFSEGTDWNDIFSESEKAKAKKLFDAADLWTKCYNATLNFCSLDSDVNIEEHDKASYEKSRQEYIDAVGRLKEHFAEKRKPRRRVFEPTPQPVVKEAEVVETTAEVTMETEVVESTTAVTDTTSEEHAEVHAAREVHVVRRVNIVEEAMKLPTYDEKLLFSMENKYNMLMRIDLRSIDNLPKSQFEKKLSLLGRIKDTFLSFYDEFSKQKIDGVSVGDKILKKPEHDAGLMDLKTRQEMEMYLMKKSLILNKISAIRCLELCVRSENLLRRLEAGEPLGKNLSDAESKLKKEELRKKLEERIIEASEAYIVYENRMVNSKAVKLSLNAMRGEGDSFIPQETYLESYVKAHKEDAAKNRDELVRDLYYEKKKSLLDKYNGLERKYGLYNPDPAFLLAHIDELREDFGSAAEDFRLVKEYMHAEIAGLQRTEDDSRLYDLVTFYGEYAQIVEELCQQMAYEFKPSEEVIKKDAKNGRRFISKKEQRRTTRINALNNYIRRQTAAFSMKELRDFVTESMLRDDVSESRKSLMRDARGGNAA